MIFYFRVPQVICRRSSCDDSALCCTAAVPREYTFKKSVPDARRVSGVCDFCETDVVIVCGRARRTEQYRTLYSFRRECQPPTRRVEKVSPMVPLPVDAFAYTVHRMSSTSLCRLFSGGRRSLGHRRVPTCLRTRRRAVPRNRARTTTIRKRKGVRPDVRQLHVAGVFST